MGGWSRNHRPACACSAPTEPCAPAGLAPGPSLATTRAVNPPASSCLVRCQTRSRGEARGAGLGAVAAVPTAAGVTPARPPPTTGRRCVGWNATTGLTQCGAPYRQGSYLCGTCADAFYPASDGSCAACPPAGTTWERYRCVRSVPGAPPSPTHPSSGVPLVAQRPASGHRGRGGGGGARVQVRAGPPSCEGAPLPHPRLSRVQRPGSPRALHGVHARGRHEARCRAQHLDDHDAAGTP